VPGLVVQVYERLRTERQLDLVLLRRGTLQLREDLGDGQPPSANSQTAIVIQLMFDSISVEWISPLNEGRFRFATP
jgi:hypothetical protein